MTIGDDGEEAATTRMGLVSAKPKNGYCSHREGIRPELLLGSRDALQPSGWSHDA